MHKIKTITLLLCLCILWPEITFGQDFKERYDSFRFTLYGQLEQKEPLNISNELGNSIRSFVKGHSKEITKFRKAQLSLYERKAIEDPALFAALDDSAFQNIRDQMLLLEAKNLIANSTYGKYNDIAAMITLLSIDPIYMVHMLSTQVMPIVFRDYQGMELKEIATAYSKMAIGGTYLSTEELDRIHWTVTLNNYYFIYEFSVDTNSGSMELLAVKTRK